VSNQVLVEVKAEDTKVLYVLEREFAEHLRGKQKYPVTILREVPEREFQEYVEASEWFDSEVDRYYDGEHRKGREKELVLVEIKMTENIKKHFVLEKKFAELLKKKQKCPITILREASREEMWKRAEVDAWLYHEAFHYYD